MQYCRECLPEPLELVTGVAYLVTPPLVISLVEGQVECIKEGDEAVAPGCFTWH
jgi:hypothetical protein